MALTDDLVSFWPLDESSGTRNDVVGTNHLSDINSVGNATGKSYSLAADFSGANALRVASNASLNPGNTDFTFQAWVYIDDASAGRDFFGKGDGSSQSYALQYQASSGSRIAFRIDEATGFSNTVLAVWGGEFSPIAASAGQWYHVLCGYRSGTGKLWIAVDGGTVYESFGAGSSGPFSNSAFFAIGLANTSFPNFLDGRVAQAALWSADKSADAAALYNGGAGLTYAEMSGGGGGNPWHYYAQAQRRRHRAA